MIVSDAVERAISIDKDICLDCIRIGVDWVLYRRGDESVSKIATLFAHVQSFVGVCLLYLIK
jgi:hypothetical protein